MENKGTIFNEKIKPKMDELNQICAVYSLPYFASFCISDGKEGTTYENYMYGSISNGIHLRDDQIRKHINVANGFYTVPPHSANEDLGSRADRILAEID